MALKLIGQQVRGVGADGYIEQLGALAADINPNGYGGQVSWHWFYQDNVAANQTAVALLIKGDAARTILGPFPAGSVLAIVVYSNEACTAGNLTVDVAVGAAGATATGLQAALASGGSQTQKDITTQAKDIDAIALLDMLGVLLTTDAGWLPVTADILVGVCIETEC